MRSSCIALLLLFWSQFALAQNLDRGLWNFGRAFSVAPLNKAGLRLEEHRYEVKIYPGFAVVKSTYRIRLEDTSATSKEFLWKDTATTDDPFFGKIHNLPSASKMVLAGKDTVDTIILEDGVHFSLDFPGSNPVQLTTFQLCPASQAKIAGEGTIREKNGLVLSFGQWESQGKKEVLVQLAGDLSATNLIGVYPESVTGTMSQLQWQPAIEQPDMVIWYDGTPPDYKFDKKVPPAATALYEDINEFDPALFGTAVFKPVNKKDFSSTTASTGGSALYFVLFSIPWIILAGFIIFLLIRPKKKKNHKFTS